MFLRLGAAVGLRNMRKGKVSPVTDGMETEIQGKGISIPPHVKNQRRLPSSLSTSPFGHSKLWLGCLWNHMPNTSDFQFCFWLNMRVVTTTTKGSQHLRG